MYETEGKITHFARYKHQGARQEQKEASTLSTIEEAQLISFAVALHKIQADDNYSQ